MEKPAKGGRELTRIVLILTALGLLQLLILLLPALGPGEGDSGCATRKAQAHHPATLLL